MSTLKDKFVKDLTFEESRFQQLHLAHQANILVYARVDPREGHSGHAGHASKTKELARKLRPEFGKLYLASQTQECFKLMRTHDLDEASSAIDVVVMDFDSNSLRLLDMINKRPKQKESAHLALICTVIILPTEEADNRTGGGGMGGVSSSTADWQASIDAVGGATAVHPHSVASKKVMSTILDALTRKRAVELAYRDLKATKIKAAKYPFVPLFSSKGANIKGEDDDDDETDDGKFNESSTSTKHMHMEGGGQGSTGGSTASLKDMDDWTDTNSMLPEFVATNRAVIEAAKMSMAQEATRGKAASMRSETEITGVDKGARFGIRERAIADKNIVRFIQAGGNLKELQLEAQIAASDNLEDIENSTVISGVTGGGGGDGCEDNLSTAGQNEAIGGNGRKDEVGEFETPRSGGELSKDNISGDQGANTTSSVPPPPLLPPPSSPPNSPGKSGMTKRAMGSILFKSPDIDPGRRTRGTQLLVLRERPLELTLLLDPKKRPTWNGPQKHASSKPLVNDVDDAESIAGDASRTPTLDNRSSVSVDNVDLYPFIRRDRDASGVVHTVGGLNKAVATEQWKVIHLSRFEDVGIGSGSVSLGSQLGDGATTLMNEKISAYLSKGDAKREDEKLKNSPEHAEPAGEVDLGNMSQVSGPESLELEMTGRRRTGMDVTVVANATKTLKRMARDTAPDVQLNDLLPILLASGKVGVGDKDILEQGLKAELEGNHDVAINMYMRAGLHTSKPHLSKMFLAAIRYRMGKFMQALDDLTWAVESQEKVKHLFVYSKEEHFIAFYNRALVNFRLGDDEKGLEDIRMAITLNNDHLKAREILGLALRRLTKYGESIEISKQNIMIRKEIEQLEQEAELEHASKEAAKAKEKARAKEHRVKHPSALAGEAHSGQSIHSHEVLHHGSMSVSSEVEEIQTLRQVHCPVEDKGGMGSLKSRKLQRQRQLAHQEKDGSALLGEALKTFKITNGFQEDLYEGLFTRPSTLQEAMMVHPGSRTPEQIDVIASTLKLFPFLWRCSDSTINELCRCVEYRALQNRSNLYTQNNRADGVVFLLRGSIQGKLEGFDVGAAVNHKAVSEIAPYGVIGHIDLLFDTARHPASKDMVESIAAARRMKEDQLNAEFTAAGKSDAKDADSVDDFNHKKEDDDNSEQELETEMDKLPRCVQNKMFITYAMSSMCEILICKREDFNRLLYQDAYSELKKRLSIVEGCRVFSEWAREDIIRLARMGQMQVFRSGELILKQGVRPSYLSLIMKGMCKSYKSPNKSSVLSVKLADAEAKAARHDLKYTYHHKLRNTLTKGVLVPHPKATEQYKQSLASRTHVTVSEALRYSLGVEIKTLKKDLAKAIEAELKQQEEELSLDEAVESVTSKLSEVSTLQWPMMFGEACMLDPENGTSRGTIVADTSLEVLSIHKSQLQTFRIRDNVLEKMKYRSVIYPEDEELLVQKERKEQWEYQRQSIVRNLSQPKQEYLEPFYV